MERLTEEQIDQKLGDLDNWERESEKWIIGVYKFSEYLTGVGFVNEAAKYAESKQHHPLIQIDYKKVTLKMSSWQLKGLSDLDFEMAAHFNELYRQLDQ